MANPQLLQPLALRSLTARNRLWLPPMCMYSVTAEDGVVTDWHVVHYGSRAQGGFGTIIVEASAVTPEGRLSPNDLGLWEDAQVVGHRRIVEAIHAGGALAGVQLGHGGRKAGTPPWRPAVEGARSGTLPGWDLVAPSAVAYPEHATPRALTTAEIADTVQAFADAARRAVAAGYDVIELHGAHGYLIHQFLSPLSNTRTDAYGGSAEGRRRFALETAQAVREAIGEEKVLDIRLSATDWAEGGITGDDTAELARQLVAVGVDVLHVSTGGNVPAKVPVGPGYQVPFAGQVKHAVAGMTTPGGGQPQVVAVGLIDSGLQAEQILVAGLADAVATGRGALRDPYLPVRWAHELGVNDWQAAHLPVQYWRGAWR
ncbi:MAG: NADH:flavin oxidoreductase/NADH oxidase [Actinomyces ruminicola]|nr:NADH:flavin oxidoreductase/NADH oxidase [Actinomyces ruminicola]